MTSSVRILAFSAIVAVAACGGSDSPPSTSVLPRAALNGSYTCNDFLAFFVGSQGAGYYSGSCQAYVNLTNPSRVDSAEHRPITILQNNTVTRPDFLPGTLTYDSTTRVLRVTYSDRPVDVFDASVVQSILLLTQLYPPFDFSGDGVADTLQLRFRKDP